MAETTTKPTPVTIYITKDAITRGIRKARAVVIPQGLACLVDERGMAVPSQPLLDADEFCDSFEGAQCFVRKEVARRIADCEAAIGSLRALDLSTAVEG